MKILIIRLSSLGDIILTQPVVAWLQAHYPEVELHFLTKEQFKDIPPLFSERETKLKVITYQKKLGFHRFLSCSRYDIVIDLQSKFSTWLIKLVTPGARHYIYNKQHLLRRAIINHQTDKAIISTVCMYFTALETMTQTRIVFDKTMYPKLYLDRDHAPDLKRYLSSYKDNKLIALFPGATHRTKMYPTQLIMRLIKLLPDDYKILLLGNSQERELCQSIHLAHPDKTVNLAGELSLLQLIYMIDKADMVITNDSGPMHIAAALSKSQIALYGSTHPSLGFAPLNEKAIVVCKNLPCQPCSLHGQETCPRKDFACMMSIKPEEIAELIYKTI